MGLFTRMKEAAKVLRGASPTEERASAPRRVISGSTWAGQTFWNPNNFKMLSEQGYKNCVIAYRCVNEIADAFASVPWCVFQKKATGRERVLMHPVLELFDRPNPLQGGATYRANWAAFLHIGGDSFQDKLKVAGQVREMWLKQPDSIDQEFREDGVPKVFVMKDTATGVSKKTWPVNPVTLKCDLHHAMKFNPTDPWWGMSPLLAAAKAVDTHNAYTKWNKTLLDNAACPRGVVEVPDELDDDEFTSLDQQFRDMFTGQDNAGKALILEGGMTWKTVAFTPAEMDWLNGQKTTALDVCRAFKVPGQLLSIEDPTYNNYREGRAAFWESTINSLLVYYRDEMQIWLIDEYNDPTLELDFDLRDVPAFAEKRDQTWERAVKAESFLQVNERRAMVDYMPIEGGDVILIPWGMQALGDIPTAAVGEDETVEAGTVPEPENAPVAPEPPAAGSEDERAAFIATLRAAKWDEAEIARQVKLAGWASNTAE